MKPKHMKTYPKVTIMIPTYNQEDYIGEAIESSLNQDYPNLEVIVSDDFSKDKTGIIAKKYETDTRFRYFRNARNLGRVGNYHHTLYDLATGEWVINLDGDDFYTDNRYISRLMKYVSSDPKIVCHNSCGELFVWVCNLMAWEMLHIVCEVNVCRST